MYGSLTMNDVPVFDPSARQRPAPIITPAKPCEAVCFVCQAAIVGGRSVISSYATGVMEHGRLRWAHVLCAVHVSTDSFASTAKDVKAPCLRCGEPFNLHGSYEDGVRCADGDKAMTAQMQARILTEQHDAEARVLHEAA